MHFPGIRFQASPRSPRSASEQGHDKLYLAEQVPWPVEPRDWRRKPVIQQVLTEGESNVRSVQPKASREAFAPALMKHILGIGDLYYRRGTCLFTGFRSGLLLSKWLTFWPKPRLEPRKSTLFLVLVVHWLKSWSVNAYLSCLKRFLPVYIFFRCCKLKITRHRSLHILWVPSVSLTNSPFCPFHPDWARWGGEKKRNQ